MHISCNENAQNELYQLSTALRIRLLFLNFADFSPSAYSNLEKQLFF
jgi:hypothetical protein